MMTEKIVKCEFCFRDNKVETGLNGEHKCWRCGTLLMAGGFWMNKNIREKKNDN